MLSSDIGARVAGSPAYADAVEYVSGELESYGYEVERQPFTASHGGILRYSSLEVTAPERLEFFTVAFSGGGAGEASGRLVDAGTGQESEFPADASGTVVLVQRQDVFFTDMARRAEAAGAAAVIVANREPGLFAGTVEPATDLPIAAVSRADGGRLRELLAAGTVEVSVNVHEDVETWNVIAMPSRGQCQTLSGAHLDSVPWAPGAKDNASGVAVVLELARSIAAAGLDVHCFALWSAEEMGLLGSQHYVSTLTDDERDAFEAVINYDVVAGTATPLAVGDNVVVDRADAAANAAGVELEGRPGETEPRSDHLSFLDAGVRAVMLTVPSFERVHTSDDTFEALETASMLPLAQAGFALLRDLS